MKKIFYRFEPFVILFIALSFGYYFYHSTPKSFSTPLAEKSVNLKESTLFFDKNIPVLLQNVAGKSMKTLDVISFTCSESRVIESLRKAAARGVKVRLVCGKKSKILQGKMHYFLRSPPQGILHEKFMIQDGENVVISTGNISNIRHNNTAVFFEKVPTLATLLTNEIDDVIQNKFLRKCENGCGFERGTLYFSPGACRAIGRAIRKTKSSLSVAVYTITVRNPLFTALMKVIKKKLPVTLVVDDWQGDGGIVNKNVCLRAGYRGADARYDNRFVNGKNMLLHDKIAVIDGKTALVGSMNWTGSGCYRNREVMLKLDNKKMAAAVEKHITEMAARGKKCVQ